MPTGHYDQHSAMRSVGYHVAKGLKFGENRNQSPNWEDEVGRGVPWFGGTTLDFDDDRGVNIAGIAYEWLTDDFTALAWPEALLDQPSFEALKTAADDFRISPLITEQIKAEAAFAQLFEYGDLWCRSGADGKFQIGRWEHGPVDTSALPVIDSDDLTEEPDLNSNEDDLVNYVTVAFKDREHYFHDDISEPASNAGHFRQVGVTLDIQLDRPWITDRALANRYAAEYCAYFSRTLISGTLKVKWASIRALGLREGDLFKVDSASLSLEFVFRLIEIELPAARDGVCSLTVENERGIWPSLYIQPPAGGPGNFVITPTAIVHHRIWELPSPLKTILGLQIAVLAQRPTQQIVGFRVYISTDNATYDPITAMQPNFAAFGKVVNADYPSTTDVLDLTVGLQVELFGVDNIAAQTDTQRDNDTVLIVINNEIISEGQVTALGGGKYKVFGRRSRFGTVKATHHIGDEVWFIRRDRIGRIANANFAPAAAIYFKLQPYTASQGYDLTLISPFTYLFAAGPFLLNNLELYGQGANHEFTGRNPRFRWSLFDISGLGIGGNFAATALFNAGTGLWYEITVSGATGNEIPHLKSVGSSTAPLAGTPAIFNNETGLWYELSASGAGDFMVPHCKVPGSSTAPAGGAPIVFNSDNSRFYRIIAFGSGDNIVPSLEIISTSIGLDVEETPTTGGLPDTFVRFDLRVRDPVGEEVVWTAVTTVSEHIFTYEENALSLGGRRRDIIFGVRWVARLVDGSLLEGSWLEGEFNNPQSLGRGGIVQAGYDRIDFVLTRPTDLDYEGCAIWRSLDPAFAITSPLLGGVQLVHDGPENSFSILQPQGSTYYYKSATYDAFSPSNHGSQAFLNDLDLSGAAVPFTTLSLPPGPGSGSGDTCGAVFTDFSGAIGMSGGDLTLSCGTAGSTIHYSLNGAAYATHSTPVTIAIDLNDIVEAYATHSGLVDGPHTRFDNTEIPPSGGP